MKQVITIISIISTAAVVTLVLLPKRTRSKPATFAELYKDNACNLNRLFE